MRRSLQVALRRAGRGVFRAGRCALPFADCYGLDRTGCPVEDGSERKADRISTELSLRGCDLSGVVQVIENLGDSPCRDVKVVNFKERSLQGRGGVSWLETAVRSGDGYEQGEYGFTGCEFGHGRFPPTKKGVAPPVWGWVLRDLVYMVFWSCIKYYTKVCN